jgi:hypothetical protein
MYHESFSCRIAFVARTFLGSVAFSLLAFPVVGFGGTMADRSLMIWNVLKFSRWNSSSKYILGIIDSDGGL